ncbi:hypothetical protein ACQR35_04680 [Pseudarthrobacter sp. J1738]|uniref:hypothetical protein n=1 Tax=unclassified Pseudarthrobacter TaxID=2647000 RepID=UPI003D2E40BC
MARARAVDDGAVRLFAQGRVLACYVCVLKPTLLGEGTPTILGLRTMALTSDAQVDITVPISAVLDRLARLGENDVELPLPVVTAAASWAGVSAPRGPWTPQGAVMSEDVKALAMAGMKEVAEIIPDQPGALIVNNARATVWSRPLSETSELPLGAAFAAFSLGFLVPGTELSMLSSGRWQRLSSPQGHVLVRGAAALTMDNAARSI